MSKIYYLLFSFIMVSARGHSSDFFVRESSQPYWSDQLNLDSIEKRLRNQPIVKLIDMHSYLSSYGKDFSRFHEVYLAVMADGLKAVFKPERVVHNSYAEIAAYRVSKWLGLRLVPPTVFKKYNGKKGSLQFFIEHSHVNNDSAAFSEINQKDLSDMQLFCFIFGKWDTHPGNLLICESKGKTYPVLIDNTSIYSYQQVQYGDFPFLCYSSFPRALDKSKNFPFHTQQTVPQPTIEKLKKVFGYYMSDRKIRYLLAKKKPITYCIWNNSLWIKIYKKRGPSYTKVYYQTTLNLYKKLNKKILEEIWAEGLMANREYITVLIKLILERRDQVLRASQSEKIYS